MELQLILDRLGLKELPCKVIETSKHLRFYELGAYFETESDSWIEINPRYKLCFLGYTPEVVITHELIHSMRKNFPDSYWEELLAYQVCSYAYQRFLGPLLSLKAIQFLLAASLFLQFIYAPAALCLSPFFCFYLIKATQRYQGFKRVKKKFLDQGLSSTLAFQTMIKLSPDELSILSKKTSASIGDL